MKHLVVFDFDYTIVDCNSDTFINQLCPNSIVPEEIKGLFDGENWTSYMAALFKYLFANGIRECDYRKCMQSMPFTDGMKELIDNLKNKPKQRNLNCDLENVFELIIISDSNTYFINTFLAYHGLEKTFREIFTNPGYFDDSGCLIINEYHHQTECKLSSVNICKGLVLDKYIEERRKANVEFKTVSYIGDGQNDLCPSLRLRKMVDNVFVRKNFSLEKILARGEHKIGANVFYWQNANEIEKKLFSDLDFITVNNKNNCNHYDDIKDALKLSQVFKGSITANGITPSTPPPSPATTNDMFTPNGYH